MFPTPDLAKQFNIISDYPLDKLVYILQDTFSIGTGGTKRIPHGLPFVPLLSFQWSFTPNFDIAYEDNTGAFPSGNPGYFFTLQVAIDADSTDIVFNANGTLGSTPIYVRVIAYPPDDALFDLTNTESLADSFVINSDKNYLKLVDATHFTLNAGASNTVPHNLGYKPQILSWFTAGGISYPMSFAWIDENINLEVTDTDFIFRNQSLSNARIDYRYYLDE